VRLLFFFSASKGQGKSPRGREPCCRQEEKPLEKNGKKKKDASFARPANGQERHVLTFSPENARLAELVSRLAQEAEQKGERKEEE